MAKPQRLRQTEEIEGEAKYPFCESLKREFVRLNFKKRTTNLQSCQGKNQF